MLDLITPVLLTCNDAPNIGRVLARLRWAADIVVVDSGSCDQTLSILRGTPRVRVFHRDFDNHPEQWRHALEATSIRTPWVLRLDSDYLLSDSLVSELACLNPGPEIAAYRVKFDYAVFSRRLVSSLYPSKPVLLRLGMFSVTDEGHTEGWLVHGLVGELHSRITHDDWKSMSGWTVAQARYMTKELEKLQSRPAGFRDWLRRHPPLMPIVIFFYCLLVKGLLFSGRAGLLYTIQRTTAEAILSLFILETRTNRAKPLSESNSPATQPLQSEFRRSEVTPKS